MSGISYILIIDELHRSICAEMGAYVCPFGPLLRSGPLQSPLAGIVQKIRIVFPATLPTRPDLYAVLLLCMVRANTPPVLFLLPPFCVCRGKGVEWARWKIDQLDFFMMKVIEKLHNCEL